MAENNIVFADFIQDDQFELHSYLTYLFNQFHSYITKYEDERLVDQSW